MKGRNNELTKEKEPNYIIISKQGINSSKKNRSFITLKGGDKSLTLNINTSLDNNINQQRIIQTITNIRKHFKDINSNKSSSKNKIGKYKTIDFNENVGEDTNNEKNRENTIVYNNKENEKEKGDDTQVNIKDNKELSSIIIEEENKLSDNCNNNIIEIEDNFVTSLNKKSVRTQLNKKDRQKSIQQSDRAEISKLNSESDNVTEFDNKIKALVKFRYDSSHAIKGDINEKEEIENELIDNDKELITVVNKNKNEEKEEKIAFKQDIIIKNNFLDEEKNDKNKNNNKEENKIVNNKNILIDISKDNKLSNDGSIANENVSENKNLIPMIVPNNTKNNKIQILENKEKTPSKKKKSKPISIIGKGIKNSIQLSSNRELLKNSTSIKDENNRTSFYKTMQFIQKNCFICEKSFYLSKLYCADCGIHFLCRKCLKSYYEEYIENKNNSKILKCPFTQCDKQINYEIIKNIISEGHQKIYELNKNKDKGGGCININNLIYNKFKLGTQNKDNNLKMYSEKHVLDISSNMNFFMFKKSKDIFCPKCLNPNLFSKTNNYFIKCLYCGHKICKYCLKEYTSRHLDLKVEGYCKVYFRRDEDIIEKNNYILIYLLQLFFVIAMYLFTFSGAFFFFYDKFKVMFRLNNKRKNLIFYIKKVVIIINCIIFLVISCPFIVVCYPFFPLIIALFDF